MSKEDKQLKKALLSWAYDTGSVYMTDKYGPEGVIACDEAVLLVEEADDDNIRAIYFQGDDELKALLRYTLRTFKNINLL